MYGHIVPRISLPNYLNTSFHGKVFARIMTRLTQRGLTLRYQGCIGERDWVYHLFRLDILLRLMDWEVFPTSQDVSLTWKICG